MKESGNWDELFASFNLQLNHQLFGVPDITQEMGDRIALSYLTREQYEATERQKMQEEQNALFNHMAK